MVKLLSSSLLFLAWIFLQRRIVIKKLREDEQRNAQHHEIVGEPRDKGGLIVGLFGVVVAAVNESVDGTRGNGLQKFTVGHPKEQKDTEGQSLPEW